MFRIETRSTEGYWCIRQVFYLPEHLPDTYIMFRIETRSTEGYRCIRQLFYLPETLTDYYTLFRMETWNPEGYWCIRQVCHLPEHLPDPGARPECAGANQREAGVRRGGGYCRDL